MGWYVGEKVCTTAGREPDSATAKVIKRFMMKRKKRPSLSFRNREPWQMDPAQTARRKMKGIATSIAAKEYVKAPSGYIQRVI